LTLRSGGDRGGYQIRSED